MKKKKKKVEPRVAKRKDKLQSLVDHGILPPEPVTISGHEYDLFIRNAEYLHEAVECLKHYTKKDQIGELANPAIELLTRWGKLV